MPSLATKKMQRRRSSWPTALVTVIALIAPLTAALLLAGITAIRSWRPVPTITLVPSLAPVAAVVVATPAPATPTVLPTAPAPPPASPTPPPTAAPPETALPTATASLAPETDTATPAVISPATPTATGSVPAPPASPTPTGSPADVATATGSPTPSPTATVSATPDGPTPTPSLTPPATAQPGWAFANVRLIPDPANGGLYAYGELVNNTGATQQILNIAGSFYDAQGGLLAGPLDTLDRTPTDVLPPGGRLPFELLAIGPTTAANYALSVQARPSALAVRDTFTFTDTSVLSQRGQTCLAGTLQRPDPALADLLTIAVAWVDEAGRLVALSDPYEPDLEQLAEAHSFTVCTDLRGVPASGYLLRAWGR